MVIVLEKSVPASMNHIPNPLTLYFNAIWYFNHKIQKISIFEFLNFFSSLKFVVNGRIDNWIWLIPFDLAFSAYQTTSARTYRGFVAKYNLFLIEVLYNDSTTVLKEAEYVIWGYSWSISKEWFIFLKISIPFYLSVLVLLLSFSCAVD